MTISLSRTSSVLAPIARPKRHAAIVAVSGSRSTPLTNLSAQVLSCVLKLDLPEDARRSLASATVANRSDPAPHAGSMTHCFRKVSQLVSLPTTSDAKKEASCGGVNTAPTEFVAPKAPEPLKTLSKMAAASSKLIAPVRSLKRSSNCRLSIGLIVS